MSPGRVVVVLLLFSAVWPGTAIDEGQQYVNNVGVYVYKSVANFTSHIKNFIGGDLYNGAHYYVQAPYVSTYRTATATIIQPPGRNGGSYLDTKGLRHATICFSILAANGYRAVDMCVQHAPTGTGWYSMYYAGYLNTGFQNVPVLDAVRVAVSVTVKKTTTRDQVGLNFQTERLA